MEFETKRLSADLDVIAPDGSEARIPLGLERGSMAHFQIPPGHTSRSVAHKTVEEIWLVLHGRGEMWRGQGDREETVSMEPGVCLSIPAGTRFQFRCLGREPLQVVGVTMPSWPGGGLPSRWDLAADRLRASRSQSSSSAAGPAPRGAIEATPAHRR